MNDCDTCEIVNGKRDGIHNPCYLKELKDGWILNHCNAPNAYLGYLILSTKQHRSDISNLSAKEFNALGFNIKWVNENLKKYWLSNHSDDPIEQIYFAYYNETPFVNLMQHKLTEQELPGSLHVHIHILPRTKKMREICNGEKLGWDLLKTVKLFPAYVFCSSQGKMDLMTYLKRQPI